MHLRAAGAAAAALAVSRTLCCAGRRQAPRRLGTLSHIGDASAGGGYAAAQVDVHEKPVTRRRAVAEAVVWLPAAAWDALFAEGLSNSATSRAAAVLAAAQLAGVLATKRTAELIPLCHTVPLDGSTIAASTTPQGHGGAVGDPAPAAALRGGGCITLHCTVIAHGRTGVEMEAMLGASVAALTVYDMTKSASKGVTIRGVRLLHKSGGKSVFDAPEPAPPS